MVTTITLYDYNTAMQCELYRDAMNSIVWLTLLKVNITLASFDKRIGPSENFEEMTTPDDLLFCSLKMHKNHVHYA